MVIDIILIIIISTIFLCVGLYFGNIHQKINIETYILNLRDSPEDLEQYFEQLEEEYNK